MRHLLKFLHTLGAIGLIGAMAALLVLSRMAPPPAALEGYALIRGAMGVIATWIFFPSLGVTLIAASGILLFESGFVGVLGPIQQEAEQSALALAGSADPATLGTSLHGEQGVLWVLLAVAIANVVLGVWRPRLARGR